MDREELGAWLRLLLTPGLGPVAARRLLTAFGLPTTIWQQPVAAHAAVVGPALAHAMREAPSGWSTQCEQTLAWLQSSPSHELLSLADPRYPQELLQVSDPPLLLYVDGDVGALHHPQKLAIVGSRNPTPAGLAHARQFARAMGEAGSCVVSGLALGVDGAAHQGALEAGAPTLALVGTGLDQTYPARHRDLALRIAAQGAVVSEFPLGSPPLAAHFPKRNRLIAALGRGTLVVEAALQSGSLITARLAADLGREVFAIPGSVHAPQSRGCHALIRQGAKLVETATDILEELQPNHLPPPLSLGLAGAAPSPADPLLDAMGFEPIGLDALQARTGWATDALLARLLELELDGHVGRLPGGLFQRTGTA